MKGRIASAAALLVVAALGLTGCDTKVGVAAIVGSDRLTDSQLGEYLTDKAAPFENGNGGTIIPKSFALQIWVANKVITEGIHQHGGVINQPELDGARVGVLGQTPIAQVDKLYVQRGFTTKFSRALVDQRALIVILEHRLSSKYTIEQYAADIDSQGQLAGAAVTLAQKIAAKDVSVSSRYGAWQPKTLSIDGNPGAGLPGFVSFAPNATGDAAQ